MTPRILTFAILLIGSSVSAKDKKTSNPLTWKIVAQYVLDKGTDNTIKAPSARMLGYDTDVLPAKGLRIKSGVSKDKKEHAVHVSYDTNIKGKRSPKDIVLGVSLIRNLPEGKSIEGYRMRLNLDGSIVSVMRAGGIVGEVKQTTIAPDSEEALAIYSEESTLHLKDNLLEQLTK